MENKKELIGIIGAMKEETDILRESLSDAKEIKIGRQTFVTGTYGGHDVVVSTAGIGKVNASACACAMILNFGVSCLINTGIAGSLDPEIRLGDVVIAGSAVEHDLDYGVLGDPDGYIYMPDGSGLIDIPLDSGLSSKLVAASRAEGLNVFVKKIATGDRFVFRAEDKSRIYKTFGASSCEMEGAAIAHVCHIYGVPCSIVRSISDNADGSAEIEYPVFKGTACKRSTDVVLRFLREL